MKIDPDRRQNLGKSDKGLWFTQLSESEAATGSASPLDVSAFIKKN